MAKRNQISGQGLSGSDGNYCPARSGDGKPRSVSRMGKHVWIKGYSLISSVLSSSACDITMAPFKTFKNSSPLTRGGGGQNVWGMKWTEMLGLGASPSQSCCNTVHCLNCLVTDLQLWNFATFKTLKATRRQRRSEPVGLRRCCSKCFGASEGNKLIMDGLGVRETRASIFNEEICVNH